MRENIGLFKAKEAVNKDWVEGYFYKAPHPITGFPVDYICSTTFNENTETWEVKVDIIDPETLCEFTGLTDKNGNKIWENNIVKHCAENKPALVEFVKGQFSIAKYGYWLPSSDCFEVIGNKFDNPELLEVKNDNNKSNI